MREVGILHAKTHLSALVEEAANGEEITITRHGKEVARLIGPRPPKMSRAEIAEGFRKLREEIAAKYGDAENFDIKTAIEDGRA